jgi:tetratricopeptide (TPR) repeat protein
MEAFFLPGTATLVISGVLLYYLLSEFSKKTKRTFSIVLFISAVIVSLISLLSYSQVLTRIPQLPTFMKDPLFNTLGGSLPLVLLLGAILPLGISLTLRSKDAVGKMFMGVCSVIVALALGISIFNSLPGKLSSPRLPDFNTSWAVTIDTLKESPLLGVGPGNYLTAFNRFKPLSYNITDLWNIRFTSARNFYMTAITEAGLLAAFSLVLIFLVTYRIVKEKEAKELYSLKNLENGWRISLIVLLVLLALFSTTPTVLILLFILLALNSDSKISEVKLATESSKLPSGLVSLPIVLLTLTFFYFGGRALYAERVLKQSVDALNANDGRLTYDLMRKAIEINPYVDRYHASYTQVNLALAQGIAIKEDLTDEERATIAQLIQQAIRESKATVTLNTLRAGNWELLARTYQAIMAFAQGADEFTIQSFSQAIALDPTNPNLRIALGGVYYSLGRYDEAIRVFELAVVAKPDLANAHFNLSAAYREKGETQKAIDEINAVIALVDPASQDYQVATTELENLQKRQESDLESGESLNPPQETEELIQPPLELPEDSNPPEVQEVSPTPQP